MKKITLIITMLFITAISFSQTTIYSQNFDAATLPPNWHNHNIGTGSAVWTFGSNIVPGTVTDFTTNAAIFNDETAGIGFNDLVYLYRSEIDVSTYSNVILTYDYAFNLNDALSNTQVLHVSLWDNLNSGWIVIASYSADTNPTTASIDISAALSANSGIDSERLFFGFGYDDINSDQNYGAGIDNVVLSHNSVTNQIITHTTTATNTTDHETVIDYPYLNGNPSAKIVATHNWVDGTQNTNRHGVSYNGTNWTIHNEDSTINMPINTSFNIFINGYDSNTITHVANASTQGTSVNLSVINNDITNNNPNAVIILGRNNDPFSIHNDHPMGVYYDIGINKWSIYNQDGAQIVNNSAYNIILSSSETDIKAIQHQATPSNTSSSWTEIDHIYLNNRPNAKIVMTHTWGTAGEISNVTLSNTQSVHYDTNSDRWRIINDDNTAMNANARFNLMTTYDPTANINDDKLLTNINIYPNPVNEILNIKLDNIEIQNIGIYSLLGQKIIDSKSTKIDVSSMENGIYLVKVNTISNKTLTKKFIKK